MLRFTMFPDFADRSVLQELEKKKKVSETVFVSVLR
jgi:hypothetical protein